MPNLSQRIREFFRPTPKSLTEKLAVAAERVPRLIKNGHGPQYDWLRIADVANAFWGEVRHQGLLVIPNDIECGFIDANNAWVKTQFVVDDGKQSQSFVSFGQGYSAEGHALHIAQSTALKSWLKRLGMTFGEEDDQEVQVSPYTPPETPKQVKAFGSYQERAWDAALATCGKTHAQIEAYMLGKFGIAMTREEIVKLTPEQFDVAIRWLSANGDLADTLEVSRRTVARKKAQPITEVLDRPIKDELAGD